MWQLKIALVLIEFKKVYDSKDSSLGSNSLTFDVKVFKICLCARKIQIAITKIIRV
jgi:hypothetical protein